ncbi:MAG: 7 transmembrane receptor, partial [Candidatus Thiodiazotropha endolucinida]
MESTLFAAGNITTEIVRNFTENNTSFVAQNTSSSDITIPSPLWFSYVIFAYLLTCLLVSLGLFGNFTTLVVLQKSKTLSAGSRLTLMALAVSDTGSLITWTINHSILPQVLKIDIVALTVTGCRLFKAVFRISSTCSALFVVLICIERFTVVWFPLKSDVLQTKAAAIASISFAVGIAVMLAVPVFIFTKIINGVCTPQQNFETLLLQIPEYISIAAYSIIPALVLICLTPLIIVKLYKQQSIRRR